MKKLTPILFAVGLIAICSPNLASASGLQPTAAGTGAGISGGGVRSTPAPEPTRHVRKSSTQARIEKRDDDGTVITA